MMILFRKPFFKWSFVGIAALVAITFVTITLSKISDPASKAEVSPSKTQDSLNMQSYNKKSDSNQVEAIQKPKESSAEEQIIYKNSQYGFSFTLPASWKGYSVIADKWEGEPLESENNQVAQTGPMLLIRHPLWTSENKRQDIPIMILTLEQWNLLKDEKFHIGAAPINPSELGRNNKYVFALPARYNYAFPVGFEEVEQILNNKPLQTFTITAQEKNAGLESSTMMDYFPLYKGNKWIYHGSGNEYASFSREVLFTEGNVAQIIEINGGADVTKIVQISDNTVTEIFKRVEQSYPVNLLQEKPNEQKILLKAPLLIGTKWNDGSTQFEIVDTSATVKTPAGTFKNCIKIKSTSSEDSSIMYQYYAKGIGMVEQDFIVGEEKISSSLESYHLVK